MKKRFYILFILLLFMLFLSCSKWEKSNGSNELYLPHEAKKQGDTIVVDTLAYLHFGFSIYETNIQIQISLEENFTTLIFDSQCHEYSYIQISGISLTYFAQVQIEKFQLNTQYFCRKRHLSENCFPPANYEWSDWSRVGYFKLKIQSTK